LASAPDLSTSALSRRAVHGTGLAMDEAPPPASREERLAAKLRENLRRRKAQARAAQADKAALPKDPAKS
jgi:hypothetical protein